MLGLAATAYSLDQRRFDGLSLVLTNGAVFGFLLLVPSALDALRFKHLLERLEPLEPHEAQELQYYEGLCPEAGHWGEHRQDRTPCQADLELARQVYEQWRDNED